MPEGEIPFNAYEDRKVKELSERIISRESGVKTSSVHIVSGSKGEQVRRIAYLTVMKLIESGAEIIPVSGADSLKEDIEKTSKYKIFLLDENEVRNSIPEGESFTPDHIALIMRNIRSEFTMNHAIFLSLSQETYDSGFRENIGRGSGIETPPMEERQEKKTRSSNVRSTNSYWYAFLLPGLSFLLSIFYHLSEVTQFPNAGGNLGFPIFQEVIYPALFASPIVLSVLGIVILFFLGKNIEGRGRRVLHAGLIMLMGEISVPVLWAAILGYPFNWQILSSPIIGNFTIPLLLFVIFQSVAVISFLLIPLSQASKLQGSLLAIAFIVSISFLVGVYINVSFNISPVVIGLGVPTSLAYPMESPYNTIFFGLIYGPSQYITSVLNYLSYISQGLFGLSYIYISLTRRRSKSTLKNEDKSPEPQTA